jgi:hypothetical protein
MRSEPYLAGFELFDKGFNIRFGLLFGKTPEIVEITVYSQGWDPQFPLQSLRHAIPVVRIVGARLGIMEKKAI